MVDSDETNVNLAFHQMGLDDRILKAIAQLGWEEPTAIQEKAIPLVLEGRDVLARARTGSGKTAAFVIPMIQKILMTKQSSTQQCTKVLVMTPTKELCNQAYKNIKELTSSCSREVKCVDISGQTSLEAQRPLLKENPDVVIGTPSRILSHINAENLDIKQSLEMLIIDEADLVFSFGYEDDVKQIMSHMPKIYQAILMSATLGEDVLSLKKLVLNRPVILKLEESQLPESEQLTQYLINCEEDDKFLILYTLLKLRLVQGKSIVFVNSVDRCYKLKLFLEQFSIRSCALNSELPVNSRCHIVDQFNKGLYDIIIAADEVALENPSGSKNEPKKKKKGRKKDKESGVVRGIDFQFVSNVVNFDFPRDADSYIHRVGRTARGRSEGTALSFVSSKEFEIKQNVEEKLATTLSEGESVFQPYNFNMKEIEGFRYRCSEALLKVTRIVIRDTRLKEIKSELLTSKKLKTHFEDNPRDLQVLRHDKTSHSIKVKEHLKTIPDYLVPTALKGREVQKRRARNQDKTPTTKAVQKRQADPLRSFQFTGLAKKKKVPTVTLR